MRLQSAAGLTLLDLTYATSPPWPSGTAGGGYSLVFAHPGQGPNNPLAWRASITTNGTPGGTDATLFSGVPDADADADGLPALLEYALGTLDNNPASGPEALRPGFSASGAFQITFTRSLAADDVSVEVQTSDDLSAWSSAQRLSSEPVSTGWVRETWGTPATERPQAYLRIRVLQS